MVKSDPVTTNHEAWLWQDYQVAELQKVGTRHLYENDPVCALCIQPVLDVRLELSKRAVAYIKQGRSNEDETLTFKYPYRSTLDECKSHVIFLLMIEFKV